MGQRIREVVELAAVKQLRRHVVLEPEHLGDLHLDAHGAADVLEQLVLGVVDELRLGDGAVVQPQDDVAVVAVVGKGRPCDGHGLVRVVGEDGQGACRVEADALDLGRVDGSFGDDAADAFADAEPDVGRRLLLQSRMSVDPLILFFCCTVSVGGRT
jgi:hypothetical protein